MLVQLLLTVRLQRTRYIAGLPDFFNQKYPNNVLKKAKMTDKKPNTLFLFQ